MSLKPRYIASLFVALGAACVAAGAATAIALTPTAAADPVWPVGGGEDARATLQDLSAQGYDIQINWVSGYPTVPLFECWVDAIHNPDGPPNGKTLTTVYVDIGCPSNNFD